MTKRQIFNFRIPRSLLREGSLSELAKFNSKYFPMGKTQIAITLDEQYIEQLDTFVSKHISQNRSQAIQEAVKKKLARIKRTRLAKECAQLDPTFEKAMADEGLLGKR
jgi:Arc/MetJ-type ribon-helix-helix transcriptional regulator